LKHQDWRKKFGPSGEGNKEFEEKSASGVKTKSKPFKKNAKKIKNVNSNCNNKTTQRSNKKASGDGWLGRIEKGIRNHLISCWG
jgi:hypothetical protein